ncbi:MAG: peptidylprolyl isomerase [Bdellovibrionaceae bacterium]|nr:peptidylprolyl isomerase [Pseudobdellovibrionaceae bacterium]
MSTYAKGGLSASEILKNSNSKDWRAVDNKNVLYMEIPNGRVIIELNPEFAPRHVVNIQKLAQEKYWDGLAIVRTQDNYVVQWGDPNSEDIKNKKAIKSAAPTLAAEFEVPLNNKLLFAKIPDRDTYATQTGFYQGFPIAYDSKAGKMWMTHCYGMVGAGRNNPPDSGGGTELYVVIGQAPRHLDRNVTLVGRVLEGMDLLSTLPRGTGPMGFYEKEKERIPIRSMRLASDVSEKEKIALEVLRTDTKTFNAWLEARRNRQEDWFHYSVGHIDVCNLSVPVRRK